MGDIELVYDYEQNIEDLKKLINKNQEFLKSGQFDNAKNIQAQMFKLNKFILDKEFEEREVKYRKKITTESLICEKDTLNVFN